MICQTGQSGAGLKVLALQFKYLGDVVLMVPALRAMRRHWAKAALHVLVPDEAVPLVKHLDWIDQVWGMPRRRGQANGIASLPIIRELRRERFDASVDFGGNDRGAILSWLGGARRRLGRAGDRRSLLRWLGYTEIALPDAQAVHQSARLVSLLSAWQIPPPDTLALEIQPDPALSAWARDKVPDGIVLGHIAASKPKKEWPLSRWAELHQLLKVAGRELWFSSGPSPREQAQLTALRAMIPTAKTLPATANLAEFLSLLQRATLFISGDTGPLHFAAGLGVPTIALFGPTKAQLWAPLGPAHRVLQGMPCTCPGPVETCISAAPCLESISAAVVMDVIGAMQAAAASRIAH